MTLRGWTWYRPFGANRVATETPCCGAAVRLDLLGLITHECPECGTTWYFAVDAEAGKVWWVR